MEMNRIVDVITDELYEQLGPYLSRAVAAKLASRVYGGSPAPAAEAGPQRVIKRSTTAKRGPGRPRKNAVEAASTPRRGPGRPPKDPNAPRRGPGRPRKNPIPQQATNGVDAVIPESGETPQ
jgi:hypothetical protein